MNKFSVHLLVRRLTVYFSIICVDERLNNFRGKCSFRQFMPSKPAKYGLKIWVVVCNETGIACDVNIYLGKTEAREDSNKVGENVLLIVILI